MHSQSVLCVDDSPTELRLMVKALQGTRLKVLQATDGEVALEMAVEHQPDLILLDIILPKKNGFQVCRQSIPHFQFDSGLPTFQRPSASFFIGARAR